jgi:predicted O-methyltransferase YrrM
MTRRISHLTPRYIRNRLLVMYDEARNPENPWLTKQAVHFLSQTIRADDVGIEFGSGRSTIWFARRLRHLISVENNPLWYAKVTDLIRKSNLVQRVDYRKCDGQSEYIAQTQTVDEGSLDFCLVDGESRDACALNILPKLRAGALLVIDNVNWYLPHPSTVSPDSRRPADGCRSEIWAAFSEQTRGWRRYWTSSGVTDTCIWIKP